MERFYVKRPGGSFYGRYYDDLGKRKLVCLKTRDRRVAEQRLRRIERGQAPARVTDPSKDKGAAANGLTLDDVLDRYLSYFERCVQMGQRSSQTHKMHRIKAGHLTRVLGDATDVRGFNARTEESYVETRQDEGASDHTIHKELNTLRASLKRAMKDGLFDTNLASLKSEHSPNYVPRRTVLTRDQYVSLLSFVPPDRAAAFAFIVLSAARDAEWQRVERRDVDFASDLLLRGTKTEGSLRKLPLKEHVDLAGLLSAVMGHLPPEPSTRLFPPWTNIRRDLHAACDRVRRAGDPTFPRVSPNDLRRTFATWCINGGMSTAKVARLLGHRDARMVEKVYGVFNDRSLGRELGQVFDDLKLPPVPRLGSPTFGAQR